MLNNVRICIPVYFLWNWYLLYHTRSTPQNTVPKAVLAFHSIPDRLQFVFRDVTDERNMRISSLFPRVLTGDMHFLLSIPCLPKRGGQCIAVSGCYTE